LLRCPPLTCTINITQSPRFVKSKNADAFTSAEARDFPTFPRLTPHPSPPSDC